ncbi:MAG TPA: ester cyclase [Anaerolineae bacterium]|nr:ester cyclase [Anaerolineae bacterium]
MSSDVIQQFYDVYHQRQPDLLNTLLTPSYVGEVNGRAIVGVEAAKGFIQTFLTAFPDVHYTLHDRITSGQKVVTRWSATATHQGSFAGIEATHKPVTMLGITIFAIADNRIKTLWSVWDVFGLTQQLHP